MTFMRNKIKNVDSLISELEKVKENREKDRKSLIDNLTNIATSNTSVNSSYQSNNK